VGLSIALQRAIICSARRPDRYAEQSLIASTPDDRSSIERISNAPEIFYFSYKPTLGDPIKSEQVRMTAAIFYAKTKMGWKETVVNEPANKDDKPVLVDDARQRLIDEVDRIRARKAQQEE